MASQELNVVTPDPSILSATAELFGADSQAAGQAKTFSRLSIWNYIVSLLAPIATSGSAGDLSVGQIPTGRLPALLADIVGLTLARGDVLFFNGSHLTNLGASTPGKLFGTQGPNADPAWVLGPATFPASLEFVIDGGGGNISAGTKGYLSVPFGGTIASWSLFADASGSITVDVWKCSYAQYDGGATHPVLADSVTGGSPPAIAAATKATSSTLSGWSVTLNQGDVLGFNVPSPAVGVARVTLALQLTRALI